MEICWQSALILWPLSSQLIHTFFVMNHWSKWSQYKAHGISFFLKGVWAKAWTSIQWYPTLLVNCFGSIFCYHDWVCHTANSLVKAPVFLQKFLEVFFRAVTDIYIKNAGDFKYTMPPDFVIPCSLKTFYRCSLTTLVQEKPYHEKPLIRDCCNHKGSCTLFRPI